MSMPVRRRGLAAVAAAWHGEFRRISQAGAPGDDGPLAAAAEVPVSQVAYIRGAQLERDDLPATERAAVGNAVKKLEALGPLLPFPHSSDARGAPGLRELRPRGGRQDPRGFAQTCERARQRFKELQGE